MNNHGPASRAAGLRTSTGRRRRPVKLDVILALVLLIMAGTMALYLFPGFFSASWGEETVLVIGNQKIGEGYVQVEARGILIAVETLQTYLDSSFFWDEQEKTAVITTTDRVVHMYSDRLTAEVNLRPMELQFPLRDVEGTLYLPLLFLADFYNLVVSYYPETNTVVVDRTTEPAYLAEIKSQGARLREGPGLRYPFLAMLNPGDFVRLEDDQGGWCLVRTASGLTGYLPRRRISVQGAYPYPEIPPTGEKGKGKKLLHSPLVMTWEFTYPNPDVNLIPEMPSLQVVSPTWFHLRDGQGNLRNLADPAYVRWAGERGYQVWALVTNSFDPGITAEVLSSSALRRKVIAQLLIYARLYELDGLNLDFENFHFTYRELYTQLVRELAPLCAEEGLVLSVNVSMISEEPYWSKGFDRTGLAAAADYIALMAYDEHWATSPVPGPVASLPWVEKGVRQVLKEVPAEKLILGVPFYTRLWQVEDLAGGGESVSSKSFSMERAEQILAGKNTRLGWDSRALQNLAEYTEGASVYKAWLEDADSMKQRLELVNRYRLAGVAGWRRGLEKPEIWELIGTVLSDY